MEEFRIKSERLIAIGEALAQEDYCPGGYREDGCPSDENGDAVNCLVCWLNWLVEMLEI